MNYHFPRRLFHLDFLVFVSGDYRIQVTPSSDSCVMLGVIFFLKSI